MTTSDYKSDYSWLPVTTSDYEWLQATASQAKDDLTTIAHEHRHKNVSYDYTATNVVNALESVLKPVVLHFWWKLLKSTCDAEAVVRSFVKVSVLRNFAFHSSLCYSIF